MLSVFLFSLSLLGTALVSLGWQSVLSLTEDVGRKTRSVQFVDGAAAEYVVGSVAILERDTSLSSRRGQIRTASTKDRILPDKACRKGDL